MRTLDAIVIGAGPAGGTAALELARRGLAVAVVEKAAFPRRKVCGEFISATTWPLLEALGVSALPEGTGPPVDRVGLFARDTVVEAPMPAPPIGTSWGRAVAREHLDRALLEAAVAAGALAIQPARVTAHERVGDLHHVTLEADSGSRSALRAPLVVAAHGSWERPPAPAQPARMHHDGDLLGFKATFSGVRLARGLMPLVIFPGGYGGLVHLSAAEVGFSLCIRRDVLRRCRQAAPGAAAGEAVLRHVLRANRGLREAFDGAALAAPWLAAGPIQPGIRARYREGMFVVGNAAGEAHPLVAEGISMAIQSASLAASCLGDSPSLDRAALDAAGARYSRAWLRHFAPRIAASAAFHHLTASPFTARASVALLAALPGALTLGARASGKAHAIPRLGAIP